MAGTLVIDRINSKYLGRKNKQTINLVSGLKAIGRIFSNSGGIDR
jgi:hypothetical protein